MYKKIKGKKMKQIFTLLLAVLLTVSVFAQTPEKMSYQAVIRNSENTLITEETVGMQISILQGSSDGMVVYSETQMPTTNANGLVSIEIGNGTVLSGSFTTIDWADGPYFIKTETDPAGGTDYTVIGTSQLLSVPYALYAKTAGVIEETDPMFGASVAAGITAEDTTKWNADQTETDPVYGASVAAGITTEDTAKWNAEYTETDPIFSSSQAARVNYSDITHIKNLRGVNTGDQDLSSFITSETDPVYIADSLFLKTGVRSWNSSIAKGITATDTTNWNSKLDTEADPVYAADSSALKKDIATNLKAIMDTASQIRTDMLTSEVDPEFTSSVAGQITADDTLYWNNKVDTLIAGTGISVVNDTISVTTAVPTGIKTGEMLYWNGAAWDTIASGSNGQILTFISGKPTWKTQLKDGEVENPTTGKIWMDRNLGADNVGDYGDLYQWGRDADGHEKRDSDPTIDLSMGDTPGHDKFIIGASANNNNWDWRSTANDNLWQGVAGANNPCESGYRLPTKAEWDAEIETWDTKDKAGALGSILKLPAAGSRGVDASKVNTTISYAGDRGFYWSSTVEGGKSYKLMFNTSANTSWTEVRYFGLSVRCIKD